LKSARTLALDLYPTLFTTCCFYLVYSADVLKKYKRVWCIYLLFILSFAFRGPIGLVVPAGVICIYYLLDKNIKQFFTVGLIALFLLILCSIMLLGLASHVGGISFMQDVLRMQVAGRMNHGSLPFYFYFLTSMKNYALSFPIACVVLISISLVPKQSVDRKLLWKLIGWVMVILIGMSIPDDKKIRYVLPMVPAVALIAAYPFSAYFRGRKNFILFIVGMAVVLIYVAVIEPIELHIERARAFVLSVETLRAKQHATLVFYKENPDGLPIKYLVNSNQTTRPIFIQYPEEIARFLSPTFFVTSESHFTLLPTEVASKVEIIAKESLGHVPVVIFKRR